MSKSGNDSEKGLQAVTIPLQSQDNEAVTGMPADVNLQPISQDGDEESNDNVVETPSTTTPTTLNEDSSARFTKETSVKAFRDLCDDVEEILESKKETESVEPQDTVLETVMDTLDSDLKELQEIPPLQTLNKIPVDSLDRKSEHIFEWPPVKEDKYLEHDTAHVPGMSIGSNPISIDALPTAEGRKPSNKALTGASESSVCSNSTNDKDVYPAPSGDSGITKGSVLTTEDSVDNTTTGLTLLTSEITARIPIKIDETLTTRKVSESNKGSAQEISALEDAKATDQDSEDEIHLAVEEDDVDDEKTEENKTKENTENLKKEGKAVEGNAIKSSNKTDKMQEVPDHLTCSPSPHKISDSDREIFGDMPRGIEQQDTLGDAIENKGTCGASILDMDVGMENAEESLETMDTCDSQESTNLVIDEASSVTESRDENESQSKEETEANFIASMDTTDMPTECENKDSKAKGTCKPADGSPNKAEQISEMHVKTTAPKVSGAESDNEKDASTGKKLNTKESKATDESKDDDVITIEQPPMPIIEIDDDDDDDNEPLAKKSPATETKSDEEKPMELDEESSLKCSSGKDNNTSSSKLICASNDVKELFAVASEKTMDEIMEEEEANKKAYEENEEDTTDEVFYNKECINYECPHKHKQYFRVPQFAFSYFKVNKKKFKVQYICADCYDKALEMYEEYCGLINAKQPLLLENIPSGRQEFVEIIDSSDEEDCSESSKIAEPAKSAFSQNDLSLIERELHNTIKSVLERVEIRNQLTWSKTILSERLKRLEMETNYVDNELRSLQRKADKMHEGLYSCPKIKIRQLQPLDLNSGKIIGYEGQQPEAQPVPPVGEIERPAIQIGVTYFAVKNNPIASWVPCKVAEQVEGGVTAQKNVKYYRIKFLKSVHYTLKTVPAKYLAYYEPPTVRLPIGTRVIAYFDATSLARGREKMNVQSAFYPGIIAEPLKPNNKFRYLIFYDDGYTQYVYHKDVRLVCHVSENVWEDVHPASRDFIQKYLTQYSINRPMVQTQKGQSMNTESNGYWLHARVVDIDCSLVLMQFEGSKSHTEWIYRGSLRLGPVFKEYQKTLQKNSNVPISRLPRRTEPFIRYTEDEESSSQQQQTEKANEGNRAVARKTFGRPESMMNSSSQSSTNQQQQQQSNVQTVKHLNNSTIYVEDENKPKGKVVYYTAKRNLPPRKYTPHTCSPVCLFEITHNLAAYSPLSKPLLSGWERFIIRQKIKKVVTYRAPCGKIFRNMKELHNYLRVTKNTLNVDNFDFSHETNCLAEYVIESAIIQKRDISCGQEKMAIPLVNYYDNTLPPECKYSAKVIPTEGVHINKDPEFFVGCECDDDCSDKSKCSCWQLTIAGAKYGNPNTPIEEVGYQYKRLLEHVPTGIYECNPRCKCKQNCLNRVVQQSLQLKLQVFKTSNRGWGLRCINDVPRGTFVCVYAGHLLTEAKANEGGQDAGDEYFAELDYIEVAEQIKEGYESEVEPPEPEDEDTYQPELDDDDFTPSKSFLTRSKRQNATKSTRPGNQEDDSQERQVINFNPNADMNEDSVRENSIRKLYGKDEACYVMDAKISGNLGRYFNHSCAPNMFVQNVFVDTHDLRFPWVAFFASCNIRAGTELTWNYNYEVGVVPGKVLYCQCGAPNCRLRLL